MTNFNTFYGQVLRTVKSNTIAAMTDEQIESYLTDLTLRAVAAFRFPKIPLTYSTTDDGNGNLTYSFDEDVTQREINVLLVLIKMYWIEQQLDNEENNTALYFDKDVKLHSRGNLMKVLADRYREAKKDAKTEQYNYGRVNADGEIGVGLIYDE